MEKNKFRPHIPAEKIIPEFTVKAVVLGIILSLIFVVGNAYLGLKTGITASASVPAAIISLAIFKLFFKKHTILENNIVQTIATMGEGIACGMIYTAPALFFLGSSITIEKMFLLSFLGGLLGILFMIPMRRFLIVEEHGKLIYPEGKVCAEILKAGEAEGSSAIMALWSFIMASAYKVFSNIIFLWEENPRWSLSFLKKTEFSIDASPAFLGIGYIIGPKIAFSILAGGILSWGVIIPLIKTFPLTSIIPVSTTPIDLMSAREIWSNYVRYIGVGAVATGGIISMMKVFPIVAKTIITGLKELSKGLVRHDLERTDKDIPMIWLILGSIAIIFILWLMPSLQFDFVTIILLVILGFFFVGVTSISVGIVGSSSNPASGMTITVLLITCLIFVQLGWTERGFLVAAISMACVANTAISLAGNTSQDLKTGFLLGATPKHQQIGEIIGLIVPSLVIGWTLLLLNNAYVLGSPNMPAPQATMMAMLVNGFLAKTIPLMLVTIGVGLALIAFFLKIPLLPFALGIYLPLSLTSAIMVGGMIAFFTQKKYLKHNQEKGMLFASGLVGGDAFMGVLIAIFTISGSIALGTKAILPKSASLLAFFILALIMALMTKKSKKK